MALVQLLNSLVVWWYDKKHLNLLDKAIEESDLL
jgi:hypothetical protein